MKLCGDTVNSFVTKAAELTEIFAKDSPARDKAGGRPIEQIQLIKRAGLASIHIPKKFGGAGEPWSTVLRIVREFARADGSIAHLYGYHVLSQNEVYFRGTTSQREALMRASAAGDWFWGNSGNNFGPSLSGQRDGEYHVLNGSRAFSSGAHIADYIRVGWEEANSGTRCLAAIPADREGVIIMDDWDGIGQRQTGSGTVVYENCRVHESEMFGGAESGSFSTLIPQCQQNVLLNVFVGSAQGALEEARAYTTTKSRPWLTSGVERHVDDPWVQRVYGDLYSKIEAAASFGDRAAEAMDGIWMKGKDLGEEDRGKAAVVIAAANLFAGQIALEVTSTIFEVTGARSATNEYGLDRFWRNVRTHTLHNPAEYKSRNVGKWYLSNEYPLPGLYQ
jgi:alkylation response protein AidB-like acyl-CoA dehydrogenase